MAGSGATDPGLDADGCPLPQLVGWATQGPGTTGGGDTMPVEVSTADELRNALSGDEPRVVLISGTINTGSSEVDIDSNKTLRGTNKDATIMGGLSVGGSNVIVQNLTINGNGGPSDTVNGDGSNIWFDHLALLDGDDGILDLVNGADMITTSWNKVYYSESMKDHGHRLALLFGNDSDKCDLDGGRQRHTIHHNWFGDYVDQRMPRIYFGRAHIYNNYYNTPGNSYNIRVGTWAAVIIENNHFQDTNNPHEVSPYPTFIEAVGNIYENTSGDQAEGGNDIGVIDSRFDGSACHAALPMPESWVPPYAYAADPAESVRELVQRCAGPR
jgi:pectate lyase